MQRTRSLEDSGLAAIVGSLHIELLTQLGDFDQRTMRP
jgi:hypothetical protein